MSLSEPAPTASAISATAINAKDAANGVVAALVAYLLWGFLPLLLHPLGEAGAVLVVAERTVYSLILLAIVLAMTGKFGEVGAFLRDARKVRVLAISSVLLAGNWLLYVYAVGANELLQASFGYFI